LADQEMGDVMSEDFDPDLFMFQEQIDKKQPVLYYLFSGPSKEDETQLVWTIHRHPASQLESLKSIIKSFKFISVGSSFPRFKS
jgi:hypothetical protein